ncbi:neprilysin-1-like [Dermacentor andersoni]|uniref:neprilysin-1-like n=1 Tax=Dermacentor andersoni TaxID=34620 RepID=UPI0024170170|nr:neprilysin-1-like [Dermacentor andersoni]
MSTATPELSTRRRRKLPSGPGYDDDDDDDIDLAAIEAAGKRVRYFMGSLGALVVLFAVLVVVLPFFTEPMAIGPGSVVCASPICALYGLRLSTSVNESSEPCRDFYEFACGGWSQVHDGTSALRVMADAVLDQLVAQLRELSAGSDGNQTAMMKAAILYQTCEAVVRHGRDELPQFRNILDAVNLRWPRETRQPKLLDILINLAAEKGYAPVFELRYNASSHQLCIEPIYQLKHIFEIRATQRDTGKYWSYYLVYCSVFGMPSPRKSVFDELDALESAVIPYIDDAYRTGKPVTRFFDSLDNMVAEMGGFGIEEWLEATNRHVGVVRSINVTHWQALKVLGTLAAALGSASLFRCLEWWIVQDLGPWFHGELAALEYGGSRHSHDLRARQCLGLVERYMGVIAWAPVSTPTDVVDDVTHVVRAVWKATPFGSASNGKDGLSMLVPESPPAAHFVTQKTVEKMESLYEQYPAMTKASFVENLMKAMRTRHSLRSQFHRERVSFSSRMSMAAAPVEVYDSQERKLIMFPFALTSPLYEDGIVASVKFAGLGSKIADAIFRNATSAYRSSQGGQLPALLADFVTCLRASYDEPNTDNRVATPELDHISRAFALESSWRAFRAEALLGSGGEDVRLKNFDGYSAEKTFFVTWCHVLCSTDEPGMAKRSCNAALKQSSDFAEVFRCEKADAMVSSDSCRVPWALD